MNYVKEFAVLCFCLFLGAITRSIINFPIPEAVYGMIYLFLALNFKLIKPSQIEKTCDGILQALTLLFIPVGVGIMASYDIIKGKILILIVITVIGTFLTMGVTGRIIQFVQRRRNVRE